MSPNRELLPNPVKGFLVDMGRWRKVASIDKALRNEVGWEWKIQTIKPLDKRGRRFMVEAVYEPTHYTPSPEVRNFVVAPDGEVTAPAKKEPVMGEDIFSKTQMRRVQAELMSEREARIKVEEELAQLKTEKKETPKKKPTVIAPKFMKEGKATETPFQMLRDCVLGRLSELERFDVDNVKLCAEVCGANDRGFAPTKFGRSLVTGCLSLEFIEPAGERNGKKCYKLTEKGKNHLQEVRNENQ